MNRQRMSAMLSDAKRAVQDVGFAPDDSKELMGHLILASAIEDSSKLVAKSLDTAARQIGHISNSIDRHR